MSWAELPGQLQRFATILRRENGTRRTAEHILSEAGRFLNQWNSGRRLSATRLPMPVPRDQGLHPIGCELHDCYLSFQFEPSTGENLPVLAEFQVQIDGSLIVGDALIELQDHWRFDSEDGTSSTSHDCSEQTHTGREPHPSFHFQRGGHAQDAFAAEPGFIPAMHTHLGEGHWKSLMQYPGPRIASLPLDPILAIDYCIAQNDGSLWKRLRNVPEYFTVIEVSQERLWKPFLNGLSVPAARRRWLGPLIVV